MRRKGTSIGRFRIDRLLGHGGMGRSALARGVAVQRASRQ